MQSWDTKKSSVDKIQWRSEMTEMILKLQEKKCFAVVVQEERVKHQSWF